MTKTSNAMVEMINAAIAAALKAQVKAATKPSKKATVEVKADRNSQIETAVRKAFKKAGFGDVTPRVDVQTYNRWLAEGYKVKAGEKSIKVKQFRLFHRKQVEFIGQPAKPEASTEAQIAEYLSQQVDASPEA